MQPYQFEKICAEMEKEYGKIMYLFFIGYEFCDYSGDALAEHRKALGFNE